MEKFPILCPGSGVLFENVTKTSHTREPRGQTFLNRDVALLSISPASHGQLVKMLITLELHSTVSHFSNAPLVQCKITQKRNMIFLF